MFTFGLHFLLLYPACTNGGLEVPRYPKLHYLLELLDFYYYLWMCVGIFICGGRSQINFIFFFQCFPHFIIFFETESNYVSVGMDWKLVYRSGWSWTHGYPLASASWVLGSKMYDTMIGYIIFLLQDLCNNKISELNLELT